MNRVFRMAYRVVQQKKKKKMVRLKLMGTWVKIERKWAMLMVLASIGAFFGLIGFLYWLWYVRIPQLNG
jgi:hypothetical protein